MPINIAKKSKLVELKEQHKALKAKWEKASGSEKDKLSEELDDLTMWIDYESGKRNDTNVQYPKDSPFLLFWEDYITDIPSEKSLKDTFNTALAGLEVNYPDEYAYFKGRKSKVIHFMVNMLQKELKSR